MTIKILLNPYANRWKAKTQVDSIHQVFANAGLEIDLSFIPGPGQGKEAAAAAANNGYLAVLAAGGDGTVSEVVNGLIEAAGNGPTVPFGVLRLGTGNDFNDMAQLPRSLSHSVDVVGQGNTRQVDAGRVVLDGQTFFFDNNCALAMEPMVTIENITMTRLSGTFRYLVATVKALLKLKAWHMRVTWDDGQYEGPVYLLSVCNSPRTGGVFYMAPSAKMDDGLLDFVLTPQVSKATVMTLVPKILRGTHIKHPQVIYGRSRQLTVESEPATPVHADGEVLTRGASKIHYDLLPGKITLLCP